MTEFTLYPAIDLRGGRVVRLLQGDPQRETVYGNHPAAAAQRWIEQGATWLHVVNLDGAFGAGDQRNLAAVKEILLVSQAVQVQLGGGLRNFQALETAFEAGIQRAILGTAAVEDPVFVEQAIKAFGSERIAAGIDAKDGLVQVRGWVERSALDPISLGKRLVSQGITTAVFTNIARDGVGGGIDIEASRALAQKTGLAVIGSGGVASLDHIATAKQAGLAGVIAGKALYDGIVDLREALKC